MLGLGVLGDLVLGALTDSVLTGPNDALSATSLEQVSTTFTWRAAPNDALSATRADLGRARIQGEGRIFGPPAQSG